MSSQHAQAVIYLCSPGMRSQEKRERLGVAFWARNRHARLKAPATAARNQCLHRGLQGTAGPEAGAYET